MNRSKLLLLISVIAFMLSQVYLWVEMPRQQKAPLRTKTNQVKVTQDTEQLIEPNERRLRFDLLTRESAAFSGVKRDLFTGSAVVARPPVKVAPPPKVEVVIAPPSVPKPVVEKVEIAPVAEVVRTQLAKFTFLGYLKKNHEKSIFLTESGEIFVVKQGERFGAEDQFEAKSIDLDKMTILDINSGSLISVSLVEHAPLSLNRTAPARSQATPNETFRNQQPDRMMPGDMERPVHGRRRDVLPSGTPDSEMPQHYLPSLPPGTEMPPSWHNSSRGIPHE